MIFEYFEFRFIPLVLRKARIASEVRRVLLLRRAPDVVALLLSELVEEAGLGALADAVRDPDAEPAGGDEKPPCSATIAKLQQFLTV